MLTTTTVGDGEFGFSAAHTGLHDGECEPLHGHSFEVTLRLSGFPDLRGMLVDFSKVKAALRDAIAPLRRRTLMPAEAPEVRITQENNVVSIAAGRKCYVLPAEDVVLLSLANTTTEALAGYLLDLVLPHLHGTGLVSAELELAEARDTSATARIDLT
ncbi:MAG: 6-pyruvoyl trahydropterin synthase family protein [Sciscionella sp.]